MPSFRLELYKGKPLKDDYFPICITVTHKGKVKRKTIESATIDQWDGKKFIIRAKGRRDAAEANSRIDDLYDKYKRTYKRLIDSDRDWNVEDVFKPVEVKSEYFLATSLVYLNYIKTKSGFTYTSYHTIHQKVSEYVNDQDFLIEDINRKWLEGYELFCSARGNAKNTYMLNLKYIKRIARRAKVVNEFLEEREVSFSKTVKRKLTAAELANFAAVALKEGTHIYYAQQTFMLQYYLRGMRIGDIILLKHSHIKNGRLEYITAKTGAYHEMKLVKEAIDIINKFPGTGYILPWCRWRHNDKLSRDENEENLTTEIKNRTAVINYHLKRVAKKAGITKIITTHIARHTLASMADKKLDGDLKTIQALLGHGSRKMTEIYVNDLRNSDELDESSDKIYS